MKFYQKSGCSGGQILIILLSLITLNCAILNSQEARQTYQNVNQATTAQNQTPNSKLIEQLIN